MGMAFCQKLKKLRWLSAPLKQPEVSLAVTSEGLVAAALTAEGVTSPGIGTTLIWIRGTCNSLIVGQCCDGGGVFPGGCDHPRVGRAMLEVSPEQALIDLLTATCTGRVNFRNGLVLPWVWTRLGLHLCDSKYFGFFLSTGWLLLLIYIFNTYYMHLKIFVCRI